MSEKRGRAAVFVKANAPLEIREYPVLAPAPGGVRLKLVCSGICGTDIRWAIRTHAGARRSRR